MKVQQLIFREGLWHTNSQNMTLKTPNLVICFGNKKMLQQPNGYAHIINTFPNATVIAGSTAGEISNDSITDDTIVATAVEFAKTTLIPIKINIKDFKNSYVAGKEIVGQFKKEDLKFIFILSDGQMVNGSDLVAGINEGLDYKIPVAGGLAGDGAKFNNTLVGLGNDISEGNIVAVGFYGKNLEIGFGSKGGWGQFGPTRIISRSEKNVLYEIDGENALDLYKKYLGKYAEKLPGSALLFPLSIDAEAEGQEVVRTILSIDQENKSMTFAGNVPEGAKVRLMKANLDQLVDAASDAANLSRLCNQNVQGDKLSILISCVGRKLIFGSRIEEELEATREVLGGNTVLAGFYSYGEISPYSEFKTCQLHNQTMTITTISEA